MTDPKSVDEEPSDEALVARLVELLDVERLEENLYRGPITSEPWTRVYGGQVIGQALMAATRTVEPERPAHSLHGYFMRPGDPHRPIVYEVFRDRDGHSFTSRRVVAIQAGQPILNLACSFAVREEGLAHQFAMPDVPPPEDLPDEHEIAMARAELIPPRRRPLILSRRPMIYRRIAPTPRGVREERLPYQTCWFKTAAPLPDDQRLHRVVLAYASDMMLLATSLLPHGREWFQDDMQEASLDHAVWIHEDVRLDEWLLYTMDSPWSGHARGMNRGLVFTREGKLVASMAQEGLIRLRDKR